MRNRRSYYDNPQYHLPYESLDRQDFVDQFAAFQGQITDFGKQLSDLGSDASNDLQVIVRQQSDLISPILQNPEVLAPVIFGSVLIISSLAIAIQNFINPQYKIPDDPVSCPPGWLLFEQRCYRLIPTDLNFDDSIVDCESNGGTLASVRSLREQEFLTSMAFGQKVWIGAHDRDVQKTFVWTSGDAGPDGLYDNFKTNQPSHTNNQDCVQMDGSDGTWDDVVCTKQLPHFCQKEPSVGANTCEQSCPLGWAMEGCKCFKILNSKTVKVKHSEAEAECVKRGAHLASVTSQDIQDRLIFLESECETECECECDFWIGLNDYYEEGSYVWPSGETYGSYTNWKTSPHTPDPSLQYVKMNTDKQWENISGGTELSAYACELELDRRVEEVAPSCFKDGDYCYTVKTTALTWDNAETDCVAEGGHLATVPVTNTDLNKRLAEQGATNVDTDDYNGFWIGLNDITEEGTYQWVNGDTPTVLTSDNVWQSNQPNSANVDIQDCIKLKINVAHFGLWDDTKCENLFPYACQTVL